AMVGRDREPPGAWPPSGEVERPGRKERFARLMQRLSAFLADLRAAPPAAAIQPDLVAAEGGIAGEPGIRAAPARGEVAWRWWGQRPWAPAGMGRMLRLR